jgi:hypothetical protein
MRFLKWFGLRNKQAERMLCSPVQDSETRHRIVTDDSGSIPAPTATNESSASVAAAPSAHYVPLNATVNSAMSNHFLPHNRRPDSVDPELLRLYVHFLASICR